MANRQRERRQRTDEETDARDPYMMGMMRDAMPDLRYGSPLRQEKDEARPAADNDVMDYLEMRRFQDSERRSDGLDPYHDPIRKPKPEPNMIEQLMALSQPKGTMQIPPRPGDEPPRGGGGVGGGVGQLLTGAAQNPMIQQIIAQLVQGMMQPAGGEMIQGKMHSAMGRDGYDAPTGNAPAAAPPMSAGPAQAREMIPEEVDTANREPHTFGSDEDMLEQVRGMMGAGENPIVQELRAAIKSGDDDAIANALADVGGASPYKFKDLPPDIMAELDARGLLPDLQEDDDPDPSEQEQ